MFASNTSAANGVANYIEDVFSTYLYTGTNAQQTITNGIDLSTKGGLVWTKNRTSASSHELYDTSRGATQRLVTNATSAQTTDANGVKSFSTTGYVAGTSISTVDVPYASWTFRKQPKFFDVVTYTGTGSARTVSHNLGSAVGFLIVKRTDAAGESWRCWHRSAGANNVLTLNSTDARYTDSSGVFWNLTAPTSTAFSVGTETSVNASGGTYVAYLFAHDAGGFGLTGTDNVISCGSYTGNGSATGPVVTLGYEPQWVMIKSATTSATNWQLFDNMRGMPVGSADARLAPNLTSAEDTLEALSPTATGFDIATTSGNINTSGATYIYIAIRRGPMKVPTSGTSVFSPIATTASTGTAITTGFPVSIQIVKSSRPNTAEEIKVIDRLRGVATTTTEIATPSLITSSSVAETTNTYSRSWNNTGYSLPSSWGGGDAIYWNFQRAPSFFDEVCYTGTGSATTVAHNLGVVPELMIVKRRSAVGSWVVYSANLGNATQLILDSANASSASSAWNSTTPTSTVFSIGTASTVNSSGITYVAYLFATCAGVSKVGRYSGTGSAQTINCGFTSGARFVLIKQDNSNSRNWYVWDSARGITSSNDPFLWLNTTDAENTSTDYVDTDSTGFKLTASAPSQLNSASGTYIFLAIA
jgi:hypothetical protein